MSCINSFKLTWDERGESPSLKELARVLVLFNKDHVHGATGKENFHLSSKEMELRQRSWMRYLRGYDDPCWRSHEIEMLQVSELWPETLFTLHVESEESEFPLKKYFKSGELQCAQAELVYPEFDPAQLSVPGWMRHLVRGERFIYRGFLVSPQEMGRRIFPLSSDAEKALAARSMEISRFLNTKIESEIKATIDRTLDTDPREELEQAGLDRTQLREEALAQIRAAITERAGNLNINLAHPQLGAIPEARARVAGEMMEWANNISQGLEREK